MRFDFDDDEVLVGHEGEMGMRQQRLWSCGSTELTIEKGCGRGDANCGWLAFWVAVSQLNG